MQASIENLPANGFSGLQTYLSTDILNQWSSFIAQSTDLKYGLLLSGIALFFIVLFIFFRSREQKNDEFFYIPVEKHSVERELNNAEDKPVDGSHIEENKDEIAEKRPHSPYKSTSGKRNSLLESAYQPEWDVHNITTETEMTSSSIVSESLDPLDSVEEIRKINQCTQDQRINAFQKLITDIQITDTQLMEEFENILNNDKLDIFIEEFEQYLKDINTRTDTLADTPENMDNLIQFQSSIHFIKVLSEMMQARCLNRFSDTVAKFLDGIINGQIRVCADTTKKLQKVVVFYNQYDEYLKQKKAYKISA